MEFSDKRVDIYSHNLAFWGIKGQEVIENCSVIIFGYSLSIRELIKNLVLLGVREIAIVDSEVRETEYSGNSSMDSFRLNILTANPCLNINFIQEPPRDFLKSNFDSYLHTAVMNVIVVDGSRVASDDIAAIQECLLNVKLMQRFFSVIIHSTTLCGAVRLGFSPAMPRTVGDQIDHLLHRFGAKSLRNSFHDLPVPIFCFNSNKDFEASIFEYRVTKYIFGNPNCSACVGSCVHSGLRGWLARNDPRFLVQALSTAANPNSVLQALFELPSFLFMYSAVTLWREELGELAIEEYQLLEEPSAEPAISGIPIPSLKDEKLEVCYAHLRLPSSEGEWEEVRESTLKNILLKPIITAVPSIVQSQFYQNCISFCSSFSELRVKAEAAEVDNTLQRSVAIVGALFTLFNTLETVILDGKNVEAVKKALEAFQCEMKGALLDSLWAISFALVLFSRNGGNYCEDALKNFSWDEKHRCAIVPLGYGKLDVETSENNYKELAVIYEAERRREAIVILLYVYALGFSLHFAINAVEKACASHIESPISFLVSEIVVNAKEFIHIPINISTLELDTVIQAAICGKGPGITIHEITDVIQHSLQIRSGEVLPIHTEYSTVPRRETPLYFSPSPALSPEATEASLWYLVLTTCNLVNFRGGTNKIKFIEKNCSSAADIAEELYDFILANRLSQNTSVKQTGVVFDHRDIDLNLLRVVTKEAVRCGAVGYKERSFYKEVNYSQLPFTSAALGAIAAQEITKALLRNCDPLKAILVYDNASLCSVNIF